MNFPVDEFPGPGNLYATLPPLHINSGGPGNSKQSQGHSKCYTQINSNRHRDMLEGTPEPTGGAQGATDTQGSFPPEFLLGTQPEQLCVQFSQQFSQLPASMQAEITQSVSQAASQL
eukprot:517258-Pelagomonas_calceolata.AAC.2